MGEILRPEINPKALIPKSQEKSIFSPLGRVTLTRGIPLNGQISRLFIV